MKSRLDDVRLYNLTPPDIQSASFMISVASRDAVGGYGVGYFMPSVQKIFQ